MMLSESSSSFSSQRPISLSIRSMSSSQSGSLPRSMGSLLKRLTESHLSGIPSVCLDALSLISSSVSSASLPKRGRFTGLSFRVATSRMLLTSSPMPVPSDADVFTTLHPRRSESLTSSIIIPAFSAASVILSATITGISISRSSVVR